MKRFSFQFLGLTLCLLFGVTAFAYIPPYWMILSRMSENNGRGPYALEQDVVFQGEPNPIIANEKWTIFPDGNMRLEVTGKRGLQNQIQLNFVYENNQRHYIDSQGKVQSSRLPNDFFEHLFHFRYSREIMPYFVAQKMAPAESLQSETHEFEKEKPLPDPENFIRLARVGGVVTYAIGTPTPARARGKEPGLWIEQDQFVIRKFRLTSGVEVRANSYKSFRNNARQPERREVLWGDHQAQILLLDMTPLANPTANRNRVTASGLRSQADSLPQALLPADEKIREFYTRFR